MNVDAEVVSLAIEVRNQDTAESSQRQMVNPGLGRSSPGDAPVIGGPYSMWRCRRIISLRGAESSTHVLDVNVSEGGGGTVY